MPLLFVYDTLLRGGKNHSRLKGSEFQKNAIISHFGKYISGEVYRVDLPTLLALDVFELPYIRHKVRVGKGNQFGWIYDPPRKG
jgi:gamma-glutamylcyclotransferase (GGCT)/AIG2-like uncharacterized protein YtfP